MLTFNTTDNEVFVTFRDEQLVKTDGYIKTSVFVCLQCGRVVVRTEYFGGDLIDGEFCDCAEL